MFSCPASAFLLETEIWVHDHIVLTHVCHPLLFHAGSSVLWLLEKLLFCLTHVGEKNSQDNFWKKKKKKRQDRDASLFKVAAWQACYEASLGIEQELDFAAVNPPLEGPLWHCCLHQKLSLPTWESERRAGATPPGCSWAAEYWRLPSLQEKQAGGCTAWPVGVHGSQCLLQFRKKKKKATFSTFS